ncbi:GIY-YIG nuclease family protein [Oculatella sp. LEGE 06141]|nr:GIY-YIG nuclease family protein [Oculatella sp. LEGE 06141]MBE9182457.1 GIY-YIG nuclease family protein [Oculatella sp. LEGE 06141]
MKFTLYWFVYLLELARPLGNHRHCARYYLGSTNNLNRRLTQHRSGDRLIGSAFTAAAVERGIQFQVVKFWYCNSFVEARFLERRLKRRKNHAKLLDLTQAAINTLLTELRVAHGR